MAGTLKAQRGRGGIGPEETLVPALAATFEPDSLSTFVPSGTELTRYASGVRRLTPRECERLQGFPDDWTLIPWKGKPSPDSRRYAALGNAVTVQVAEWIGQRILAEDAVLDGV